MNENDAFKRISKEIIKHENQIIQELADDFVTYGHASMLIEFSDKYGLLLSSVKITARHEAEA